jgi:hypothetical protein
MRRLAVILVVPALAACGVGVLQTAKTTPGGKLRLTPAVGVIVNESIEERGFTPANVAPNLAFRAGVADRVDIGLSQLMILGLMADAKVNVMPPQWDFALAFCGGLGFAVDAWNVKDSVPWVLHVPVSLMASYTIKDRVTPYVSAGYSIFWIFGYSVDEDPNKEYAAREGYGDGVLRLTGGIEIALGPRRRFAILAEYSYWRPVVDDPGDFYSFVENHIALVGMRVQIN